MFQEENIGEKLHDTAFGKDFLDMARRAQAAKAKINKRDHSRLETFSTLRVATNRAKKSNLRNRRKYLQIKYLIRG